MRIGLATALFLLPVAAYSQPAISFPESFLWNAESRGPLLVVLPLSEKDGQLVTCGSLTAFAPKSYLTLKWEHLPEPDLFGQMGQEEKWELFQASLTERQWKLLGSAAGLGQTDLTKDQKKLFFALLPEPISVRGSAGQAVTVSAEQRRGTRLRLTRKFHYSFINNDGRQIAAAGLPGQARPGWQLASPAAPQPAQNFTVRLSGVPLLSETPVIGRILQAAPSQPAIAVDRVVYSVDLALATIADDGTQGTLLTNFSKRNFASSRPASNFGAKLVEPSGTHLKPSELDLASPTLDPVIALSGATTVGELVKRVSDATKRELFCDPRYAKQRVYLRGDKARAGDVLKALCWGVSGTFRKVADAYVLTEDLVPLALRLGKIADWRKAAQKRVDALRVADDEQLALHRQRFVAWSEGSRFKGESGHLSNDWRYGQQVALNQLPTGLREELLRQMDQWATRPDGDPNRAPLNRNVIRYTPSLELELLVPNLGTMPAGFGIRTDFRPDQSASKPAPFPSTPMPRTLAVSIKSVSEAKEAVRWAKSGGFTALWVQIGLSDTALLEAAIAEGKAEGIPVSALVRPLRAPGPMEQTVEAKRSSVYLRPDLLEAQAAVLPQLKQLAATPNLAGLVFTDLNPTGYVDHASVEWNEILGYAPEMRLACLRQNGPDPVDLSDNGTRSGILLESTARRTTSFFVSSYSRSVDFSSANNPWYSPSQWNLWQPFIDVRTKAVDSFVTSLTQTLQKTVPGLTVLRAKGSDWDLQFDKQRRIVISHDGSPLEWNDLVGQYLGQVQRKPEGIVFDGTQGALGQLAPLLSKLKSP